MSEPSIRVEGLRVVRGGKVALDAISLDVAPGIVTGLLGPSGGGKSTLMRAAVGVQRVDAGRVTVLGRPAGSPELRSRVGYRTQAPSVYDDLTVRENVHYFARVLGVSEAGVDEAIETVGLRRRRGPVAGRLSGGQLRARRARDGPARRARGARARRADRRPRSGAPPRPLGHVPRHRRPRRHAPRLESRDGRGRPLRRAPAPARRAHHRHGDAGRAAAAHRAPTTSTRSFLRLVEGRA